MRSLPGRKILTLLFALALAAITPFPTSAQGTSVTDRLTIPYAVTITACNGEDVSLSGEFLVL